MMKAEKNRQGTSLTVEKSNGTKSLANAMCAIFEKIGVPPNIYVDTGVSYEPWKKEDIEKTFSRMVEKTGK